MRTPHGTASAAILLSLVVVVIIFAGCVQMANVTIKITKYEGDCMPPVNQIPCCAAFPQSGLSITVDGETQVTDAYGKVSLKVADNATHVVTYKGCDGALESLNFTMTSAGIEYSKITAYNNAAWTTENVVSRDTVEINLPCCTA